MSMSDVARGLRGPLRAPRPARRTRTTSAAIRTTSYSRSPTSSGSSSGPHGTFIVDTGFDQAMADKRGRTHRCKPVGRGPEGDRHRRPTRSTDVIVSHLHYDHCGNHDLFPRARYHLQDVEMAYATGRCMCHAQQRIPFEADDVVAMVRKVFDGRVVFHDGDDQLAPGITVHHIGGHSKGLQCVRVKTRARARGAGVRRHAPLRAHQRGARLPDHLQRGRDARRLRDAAQAGRLDPTTSSPGTIRRSSTLPCAAGPDSTGSSGWTSRRPRRAPSGGPD